MRSPVARGVLLAGWLILLITGCNSFSADNRPPGQSAAPGSSSGCDDVPKTHELRQMLADVPSQGGDAGGFNHGKFLWAAVVDRAGQLCAVAASPADEWSSWAGSRAVALEKAFTSNAFSTDSMPMSTARLYTLAQPGHSFSGVENANPVNPQCLYTLGGPEAGVGKVCGGTITFGGGMALYKGGHRVGGLGIGGDTACADHEIGKRIRAAAGLNPPPSVPSDDIIYTAVDGPSPYAHPLCPNTWRNGKKIGEEAPASGY